MAITELNNNELNMVNGGSIIFNPEHTTCGLDCNNQYDVLDYEAAKQYYKDHRYTSNEPTMLAEMERLGYIRRRG